VLREKPLFHRLHMD